MHIVGFPMQRLNFYFFFRKGAATKRELHHVLTVFQRSDLYKKLRDQLGSPNVASVLSGFERLTEEHCPDIVSELRGFAEGAGVDYKEVSPCTMLHLRQLVILPLCLHSLGLAITP